MSYEHSDVAVSTGQRFVVDAFGNVFYERWDAEDFQACLLLAECPTCYRRTGGVSCFACQAECRTESVRMEHLHPNLARWAGDGKRVGSVVCAWCKTVLVAGSSELPVSHGICDPCADDFQYVAEKRRAGRPGDSDADRG